MITLLEKMLNSMEALKDHNNANFTDVIKQANEFLGLFNDRRYKLRFLACCTSYRSMIFTYQGIKYYAYHDYPTNTYIVEKA